MKSGMICKQGDIVIVPFPFTDLSGLKQRPVLVLSKGEYNRKTDDVITCGITANLKDSEYSVIVDNLGLTQGSIPVKSRIKVDKLFTLEQSIIKKKLGKINPKVLDEVKNEFVKLI